MRRILEPRALFAAAPRPEAHAGHAQFGAIGDLFLRLVQDADGFLGLVLQLGESGQRRPDFGPLAELVPRLLQYLPGVPLQSLRLSVVLPALGDQQLGAEQWHLGNVRVLLRRLLDGFLGLFPVGAGSLHVAENHRAGTVDPDGRMLNPFFAELLA